VDSVADFVRENQIDLLIPATDWTLQPITRHRSRFEETCRVATPSQRALDAVSDKYDTIRLAESLGIPVPRTLLLQSAGDLGRWEGTQFPVVVKDRFSVRWTQTSQKAVFGSVAYAYSLAELEKLASQRLRAAKDVLIQEFVSGVGIGFSFLAAGGKTYLPFQWQRIREVDPRGSGSSAAKSVPLNSSLREMSAKLITAAGFEGLAMAEYKLTKDNQFVLMEINGRPWGSIGLPMASGCDYPRYLIEWRLQGTLPPETIDYRENVVWRRAVAELTHLAALRRAKPANWPKPYPNFWKSLAAIAIPWRPGMCYDDLWFSDWRPGAAGLGNWFRLRSQKRVRK
jgi:predicted ATP-grasp superfamily ATP-dependent carboligase